MAGSEGQQEHVRRDPRAQPTAGPRARPARPDPHLRGRRCRPGRGLGVLFYAQTYTSPSGTQVAQSVGTAVVNGVTMPHVTLSFQTYPDSTAASTGCRSTRAATRAGRPTGLTNVYQVPAHALVTVDRPPVRLGRLAQQPVVRHGTGHGRRDVATINGKVGRLDRPEQRRPHLHRPGRPRAPIPGFFLNVPLPAVGGDNQADNGQYHTVVFSFVSGSKGTYAWNCEFPCGSMVASFGGADVRLRVHVGVHPCRLSEPTRSHRGHRIRPQRQAVLLPSRREDLHHLAGHDRRRRAHRRLRPRTPPAHLLSAEGHRRRGRPSSSSPCSPPRSPPSSTRWAPTACSPGATGGDQRRAPARRPADAGQRADDGAVAGRVHPAGGGAPGLGTGRVTAEQVTQPDTAPGQRHRPAVAVDVLLPGHRRGDPVAGAPRRTGRCSSTSPRWT